MDIIKTEADLKLDSAIKMMEEARHLLVEAQITPGFEEYKELHQSRIEEAAVQLRSIISKLK